MDKIRATVIGPNEVGGVTHGGTVELDPATVNVDALVAGGHIELAKAEAQQQVRTGAAQRGGTTA